jgi:hypothetical protein
MIPYEIDHFYSENNSTPMINHVWKKSDANNSLNFEMQQQQSIFTFSVLNFGNCSIKHVTYLKLRRKKMLLQAEQMYKMTITQNCQSCYFE